MAVSVTTVLFAKLALHVPGQLIPVGALVTVPEPTPIRERVTVPNCVKVAVTELGELIVNVQVLVFMLHDPVHAPKPYPLPGVAVRVTWEFCVKLAEHVPGQLMPAGLLVTVPLPAIVTVSCDVAGKLNDAEMPVAPETVTVHVGALFAHAPPHPANTYPELGDSVSVTCVF